MYVMLRICTTIFRTFFFRPVLNPTKAIIKAESFSISSNIVAESSTSLLR